MKERRKHSVADETTSANRQTSSMDGAKIRSIAIRDPIEVRASSSTFRQVPREWLRYRGKIRRDKDWTLGALRCKSPTRMCDR